MGLGFRIPYCSYLGIRRMGSGRGRGWCLYDGWGVYDTPARKGGDGLAAQWTLRRALSPRRVPPCGIWYSYGL